MTQVTVAVTAAWSQAKAGAANVNMQNTGSSRIMYRVAASTPTLATGGAVLGSGDTHPIVAGSGENIYVRLVDTGGSSLASEVEVIDAQ